MIDWKSEGRIDILKAYVSIGLSVPDIANKMKLTHDQIAHAIRRYSLDKIEKIVDNESKKIGQRDISALSRMLGERLHQDYQRVGLDEPSYKKNKSKRTEVSVLDLSDVHIGTRNEVYDGQAGRKIVTYNEKIFVKELAILQNSIFEIHNILSNSYNLRELVVNVMGDCITNDRIFQEQVFEIEKTVGLQIWDGVNYFVKFFNNLLSIYEKITIVCVVGNHGRTQPDVYDEPVENNFENSKRINVIVPDTRRYIHKVLNWKHMIEHGDQMQGFSEQALIKQIKELHLNVGGFDLFHMGHLHQIKEIEVSDKVIVKMNGAWVEKDNYAFKKFKTYSVPKQWFFGQNETRPETWSYKLSLRG